MARQFFPVHVMFNSASSVRLPMTLCRWYSTPVLCGFQIDSIVMIVTLPGRWCKSSPLFSMRAWQQSNSWQQGDFLILTSPLGVGLLQWTTGLCKRCSHPSSFGVSNMIFHQYPENNFGTRSSTHLRIYVPAWKGGICVIQREASSDLKQFSLFCASAETW